PSRLTVVFSASGDKNTIPVNSTSETLADGLAAMDSGFPPLTRIALSAGGKPPRGQDFNGIFNDVYTRLQWSAAGAGYPFSNEFSTAISGYPKG
ncbi:phage tail protein, partial [Klebsiella pneumoniae]